MSTILPMSDEMRGLLRSVKQEPDDDSLRLIFADWLEERDDPRGALMRAQVERFGLPHHSFRSQELNRTIRQLTQQMRSWLEPTPNWLDDWSFKRGLLAVDLHQCLPDALTDWSWEWTSSLSLKDLKLSMGDAQSLANSSYLDELTALHLSRTDLDTSGARTLASSKFRLNLVELDIAERAWEEGFLNLALSLPRLNSLRFFATEAPTDAMIRLASSPTMTQLSNLNLYRNTLSTRGAEAFAKAECSQLHTLRVGACRLGASGVRALMKGTFESLTSLNLSDDDFDEAGIAALTQSKILGQLTALNLGFNRLSDEGIARLADCERSSNLQDLSLYFTEFGVKGIESLARSPYLKNLRTLRLAYVKFQDQGVTALANSSSMSNLQEVDLQGVQCGDIGAEALAQSSTLSNLQDMSLYDNELTSRGAQALARSKCLTSLCGLSLDSNPIGDEGVEALASCQLSLRRLGLGNTGISNRAVIALTQSPAVEGLVYLSLGDNEITDESVHALIESPYLKNLSQLYLRHTSLSSSAEQALRERFEPQGTKISL